MLWIDFAIETGSIQTVIDVDSSMSKVCSRQKDGIPVTSIFLLHQNNTLQTSVHNSIPLRGNTALSTFNGVFYERTEFAWKQI